MGGRPGPPLAVLGGVSYRVFYVDDQEDIVWSTSKLLAREGGDLEVVGFTEPVAALEALEKRPPDVLVTDLRMEGMTGLELLVASRKVVPDLPVIVVTAYGGAHVTDALQGRSLVEYLEKPLRAKHLIETIDRLLARGRGFSGSISLPMLPDLIQVYTLSQTTGALGIRRGSRSGTIWFDRGKIVHANCGDQIGEAAVYEMLSWQGGEFSLDSDRRPTERTITGSWQEVLLEGCRLLDEASGTPALPELLEEGEDEDFSSEVAVPPDWQPGRGVLQASPVALASGEDQPVAESSEGNGAPPPFRAEAAIELAELADLAGFVGAAVVVGDDVRFVEASVDSSIDLALASDGSAEVLRAIDDMLGDVPPDDAITDVVMRLRRQFHLIRPLRRPEDSFLYLILDRRAGDLTKARLRLATAEEALHASCR